MSSKEKCILVYPLFLFFHCFEFCHFLLQGISSILAINIASWKRAWQPTPVFLFGESLWTEEAGGLQSMGSQRVGRDQVPKHIAN